MSTIGGKSRVCRKEHRSQGWFARFQVCNKKYSRYFADASYGSSEAARRAALRFASADQELHDEFLGLRRRFEPRKNSRSSVPGLARYDRPGRRAHWLAYYDCPLSNRRIGRRFYIAEHGEEQARSMAIEFREKSLEAHRKRYEELMAASTWDRLSEPRSQKVAVVTDETGTSVTRP
jgi:hypothetical protein